MVFRFFASETPQTLGRKTRIRHDIKVKTPSRKCRQPLSIIMLKCFCEVALVAYYCAIYFCSWPLCLKCILQKLSQLNFTESSLVFQIYEGLNNPSRNFGGFPLPSFRAYFHFWFFDGILQWSLFNVWLLSF